MSRIPIPNKIKDSVEAKSAIESVNRRFGFEPNLFRAISVSPQILTGVTGMLDALSKTLDDATRERISLAVSKVDGCDYCIAAHSYVARKLACMDSKETYRNQEAASPNGKAALAPDFAAKLTELRGKLSDEDLAEMRAANFSDGEVVEIIALCGQVILTNFLANVFDIDPDFPMGEVEGDTDETLTAPFKT